jgi:hypothetical protein
MQGKTITSVGQDMSQWYSGAASPIQTDTIYWPQSNGQLVKAHILTLH